MAASILGTVYLVIFVSSVIIEATVGIFGLFWIPQAPFQRLLEHRAASRTIGSLNIYQVLANPCEMWPSRWLEGLINNVSYRKVGFPCRRDSICLHSGGYPPSPPNLKKALLSPVAVH